MSAQPTARLSSYERRLLVFLSVATFFEGYDFFALAQVLPNLRAEFGLSKTAAGLVYALVNLGTVLAYVLVRKADRWGRRRVLSITIAGYTTATFATGFAPDVVTFTVLQLFARTFLIGEYCISMIYAAEEIPADKRGFALGLVQGFATLGGIFCAAVTPALLQTTWGWRTVYFAGIIPLVLLAFARRSLKESKRFVADHAAPTQKQDVFAIFRTPYRKRVLQMGAIFALVYACTNTVIAFWKDFAMSERGLTEGEVGRALSLGAIFAMPLVFYSARLLDTLGRRRAAVLILGAGGVGVFLCYTLHGVWPLTIALVFGIFGANASLSVLNTYGTELFPTAYRADAFAWANNAIGRVSYVTAPAIVGAIADHTGWGPAAGATSLGLILGLVMILWLLPETRARELEDTAKV